MAARNLIGAAHLPLSPYLCRRPSQSGATYRHGLISDIVISPLISTHGDGGIIHPLTGKASTHSSIRQGQAGLLAAASF